MRRVSIPLIRIDHRIGRIELADVGLAKEFLDNIILTHYGVYEEGSSYYIGYLEKDDWRIPVFVEIENLWDGNKTTTFFLNIVPLRESEYEQHQRHMYQYEKPRTLREKLIEFFKYYPGSSIERQAYKELIEKLKSGLQEGGKRLVRV